MKADRVVLDTNALISAALTPTGPPRGVVNLVGAGNGIPITGARLGCRDPSDDKIQEPALKGRADHLVTGDCDQIAMSPFHGIPIITPARFLALRGQASAATAHPHEGGGHQMSECGHRVTLV